MANASFSAGSGASTTAAAAAATEKVWAWSPYVGSAVVIYLFLCNILRFQRRDSMARKFNFPDRKSLAKMTNADAQIITSYMSELEFPKIYIVSVQFALFKVCLSVIIHVRVAC
jgi:hypothetical protein